MTENNIFTFELNARKDSITGFVIEVGVDWVLLIHIPVDFSIDGFIMFRKSNVAKFWREDKEKLIEKVKEKELKELALDWRMDMGTGWGSGEPFVGFKANLMFIQIELDDESVCYIGRIEEIENGILSMKMLDTNGSHWEELKYNSKEISVIEFDNDYVTSLARFDRKEYPDQHNYF